MIVYAVVFVAGAVVGVVGHSFFGKAEAKVGAEISKVGADLQVK